ncbi:MAG: nucleotidyltransferase family protein [Alphaproteobacteria bacterium]|nr:nucleotidyltransferase family protein [Alphaproteobacteria bacterium]
MSVMPHTAFVLAAGHGMRMRPLTLETAKPLLKVGGETMLDQVLDRLIEAGVERAIVNAHYKAEQIEAHVKKRSAPQIIISKEDVLLDTGGGIKHALPHLGNDPVFAINSDLPWRDGTVPALKRLAQAFDVEKMDCLLLLMPLEKARGFKGAKGDFFMNGAINNAGELRRKNTDAPRPYVFVSAQIVKPQLYTGISETVFSNNKIWDAAEEKGRLFGIIHDAACYHVGTPEDLADANRRLDEHVGW